MGGIKFYALDNEPDLWNGTHPRVHPDKPTYAEMADRSERLASAILKVDPTAQILGFVSYGWMGFQGLQDAPDSKENNQDGGTFIDYFLKKMREAEQRGKKRLIHVLDLHWYPEAQGNGKRITEGDLSPASIEARLQAPRSLWDPTYKEKSWIEDSYGKPIQLLPLVKNKIAEDYPGTKLAFTEYDYGAGAHVSGGLAQADVLGIFGKEGVFMASYWGDLKPYNKAALKLYRNYDGKGGAFGNASVSAAGEDVEQASIYASTDPQKPGTLWVVVLNKNQKDSIQGKFSLQGNGAYKAFAAYGFDSKSPEIKFIKNGNIGANQFDYSLPPLSATLFVCQ
jgi:mannan endo-1,4-beta-mannosidase